MWSVYSSLVSIVENLVVWYFPIVLLQFFIYADTILWLVNVLERPLVLWFAFLKNVLENERKSLILMQ